MKIAIFASGSGSNAERFFEYFKNSPIAEVALLCCNNPEAFVLERARKHHIPSWVFSNKELAETGSVLEHLSAYNIDFIVLAGFLRLIPPALVAAYPDRIVNIHPALLPKWGGKGMYGSKVHEAVVEAKDAETGISIHLVSNFYDEGNIVFQARCRVDPMDSPEAVAQKVHQLEHEHYPRVVEQLLKEMADKTGN